MRCEIKLCESLAVKPILGGNVCTEHHEQIVEHLGKIKWRTPRPIVDSPSNITVTKDDLHICEVCNEVKEKKDYPINDTPIFLGKDIKIDNDWERRKVCWTCQYKLHVLRHVSDELGESFTMYQDWRGMSKIACPSCYSEHFVDKDITQKQCRCGFLIIIIDCPACKGIGGNHLGTIGFEPCDLCNSTGKIPKPLDDEGCFCRTSEGDCITGYGCKCPCHNLSKSTNQEGDINFDDEQGYPDSQSIIPGHENKGERYNG